MKSLTIFINEKLIANKNTRAKKIEYNYFPETREELEDIMNKLIKERGNNADFNDIDTSKITDMSFLFQNMRYFNGNISNWDVSNVTDMNKMFDYCKSFNQDLSNWDVSKVTRMDRMFSRVIKTAVLIMNIFNYLHNKYSKNPKKIKK